MYVQIVHAAIASLVVFIVLFFAPFPFITRALIPFGYYFLFEYAVIDRDYAIGVLAAFCICVIIRREFKYKMFLYYALLFFMFNTHLLAILLGASLHLYFLALTIEKGKKKSIVALHILAGIIVFLPSLYLIFPHSGSTLNTHDWTSSWTANKITVITTSPIRAFMPVPAWWEYNCWNTQFLLEARSNYPILRFFNPLLSAGLLALVFFILRKSKKSSLLFTTNLLFNVFVSIAILPLSTGRYAGFLYIGFITAWWLYCYEIPRTRSPAGTSRGGSCTARWNSPSRSTAGSAAAGSPAASPPSAIRCAITTLTRPASSAATGADVVAASTGSPAGRPRAIRPVIA